MKKRLFVIVITLILCLTLCGCNDAITTQMIFPAHEYGKDEYNAKVFDIRPFELSIDLPKGWLIHVPDNELEAQAGFSSVSIIKTKKLLEKYHTTLLRCMKAQQKKIFIVLYIIN